MTEDIHGFTDTEDTAASAEGQIEQATKTFTQDEVNEIISRRVSQMKAKYSDIDVDEYKQLRAFKEQMEEESLIKKQDFESLLKKHKEKADNEIATLRSELQKIKVDGALINAASKAKALAPEQVAKLLKEQVKLESDGSVVVLDESGQPRYNDDAEPYTVDSLVEEFLSSNQFFRAAGPSGTGSASNVADVKSNEFDLSQLDMTKAEHREIYKKMRAEGKI